MVNNDVLNAQLLEMRRGAIVLAILSQLRVARYGYGLLHQLGISGVVIDAGTLYPLLRRLEKQGVLVSRWETVEQRPRKYYRLSEEGAIVYAQLLDEWDKMTNAIDKMTKGKR